ncbi:radical SAM protein [Geothrix sp. 21YS21S-4]|uniref:SPL family radical SAM protein n=1 Tax=Geothrix sp. 21YS21S-4 TaxID=3068889 RepID=UPI0027B9E2BA|nr:radical SAM protein [Geothrix sp. 21YS21S-4]
MTPLLLPSDPPPLFRDLQVEPEEARSILRPQKNDGYGFGFALSPYRGCAHGCRYCYVREYPNALHGPEDWGGWVSPKLNAPELLWSQRHRLHNERVFMASATDPYQPLERDYRLTRRCLEVLLLCPTTRVIIHTRSPLVLQDLDLLRSFGNRLSVGFSIPTDDDTVRQAVELRAPAIPSRWAAMERLARAGIRVTAAVAPLLAVHDARTFARRARASGAQGAWVGSLRLLKRDPFYGLLAEHGWLKVLDPAYADEVRQAFHEVFPPPREVRERPVKAAPPPPPPVRQPGLFDKVG